MTFKDALQTVQKEIAIMKKVYHPNVITLHEVIDDEESEKLYIGKNSPI
jgi:serine/threonine protein kinase